MISPVVEPPPPARGRFRLVLQSVVVMLALTACCMFAGLLIDRTGWRLDMTSTREHQLSPRTVATIGRLSAPAQLVVTFNSAIADPAAARRTRDVLDAVARSSGGKVAVDVIDIATDSTRRLDAVMARLGERYQIEIGAQTTALTGIGSGLTDAAAGLERLSEALALAVQALPEPGPPDAAAIRRALSDSGAISRLSAKDLTEAVATAKDLLGKRIAGTTIPPLDAAGATLRRPLPTVAAQLAAMSRTLEGLAAAKDDQVPAVVRDRLRPVPQSITALRDSLLRAQQAIDDLPKPPIVTVSRVLERSSAAIAIGDPKPAGQPGRTLAAVDIETLFPPRNTGPSAGPSIDMRAKTEELIGSALSSLTDAAGPVVVLMHSEPARLAPGFDRFSATFERLRNRGIDVVEWPVSLDPQLVSLAALNPTGKRPVVYATLYTLPGTADAAERIAKFSRVVEGLVKKGEPVLMSLNPSTLPSIGQPDLMSDFLAPLGLNADTGRPLMHQIGTPNAPVVSPESLTIGKGGEHMLAGAIRGLRLRLPWAIPLSTLKDAPSVISPILQVDDDQQTWAESQWIEFRAVRADQRPNIRPQDQPKEDSARDDGNGPWTVAAAVERKLPDRAVAQRLVVVGCSGWFLDDIADASTFDNNRFIPTFPGNAELLESSLFWLAGQEHAIGVSPSVASAPVIPPLKPSSIQAIRWVLIFGLPVLILAVGAAWRLIRG